MSAFVVSDYHIWYLVEFAAGRNLSYYFDGKSKRIDRVNAAEIAQLLKSENMKSVNIRYKENNESVLLKRFFIGGWNALTVIKGVHCMKYQLAEYDGYELTEAYKILDSIENEAIRLLPGYSDAQWEIVEPDFKAIRAKITAQMKVKS